MLVESPLFANSADISTTSPEENQPLSGRLSIEAVSDRFSSSAIALGAITNSKLAKTIASIRSLPMLHDMRHPLEGMRFMYCVSEDG